MLRVTIQWDPIRKKGIPTRSELVNKVIKTVKRFDVRRQGVQSAARRPIEYEEFVNLLTLRQVANMMNEFFRLRTDMQRELQRTQAVLRRIALQPVSRTILGHDATAAASHDTLPEQEPHRVSAILAKRPRDLFELWHEFEFGLNGGKPAKEFTRAERGANKFAYFRRKMFWDIVACLVRAGFTSDTAIDKIYAVYGDSTQ
ncbi:hypothetical protein PR001_g19008 [Phytophthora rubi]|uniref:Uncharacterized protein n=1 Tax=Phytophthora rubi TaxID=129364 RepID=A0A6A3K5T4_9STRA|nr:hypothetical protein PR001_g19008 [Phytophthora rubi]